MRLFAAVDLDDEARLAVAAEQKRLARILDEGRALRWVRPEQIHLTLCFLGEVDQTRTDTLVAAFGADLVAPRFTMLFAGLGVFPPRGAPNVLWLGVREGEASVIDVQRLIANRLAALGFPRETRPYHPHLTLARWRGARPAAARRALAADRGDEIARVRVTVVTLYQSRLSPQGASYAPLARAALTS